MSSWIGNTPFEDLGMTKDKMELLEELSEDSGYWLKARVFIKAITNRKLSSLSSNQRKWLTSIILELDSEVYKRSWRY